MSQLRQSYVIIMTIDALTDEVTLGAPHPQGCVSQALIVGPRSACICNRPAYYLFHASPPNSFTRMHTHTHTHTHTLSHSYYVLVPPHTCTQQGTAIMHSGVCASLEQQRKGLCVTMVRDLVQRVRRFSVCLVEVVLRLC